MANCSIKNLNFFVITLMICFCGSNGKLPDYIRPCSKSNKLNECALRVAKGVSAQFARGDPSRGIPSLEPLTIKKIDVLGGGGNVNSGFNIRLHNAVLSGIGNLDIKKLTIDQKNQRMTLKAFGDMKIDADYEMSGRLLIIPLNGKGKSLTKLRNVKIEYSMDYVLEEGKDGKMHGKIIKDNIRHDIGRAIFKLENLFNGDKLLGDTTESLINELWREIISEIGPPVLESVKKGVTASVQAFLSSVADDEFWLP